MAVTDTLEIEQIFFHCMKSFMRTRLWEPESWHPEAVPKQRRASGNRGPAGPCPPRGSGISGARGPWLAPAPRWTRSPG